MTEAMPWSGRSLAVTAEEKAKLDRLTYLRHQVEHSRPASHFIEPALIARILPVAARLTLELLRETAHHLKEGKLEAAERDVAAIAELCTNIERSQTACVPRSFAATAIPERLTDAPSDETRATRNPEAFALPLAWYQELVVAGVDPEQPGIYEWRIDSVGIYIGQYTYASRPRREYARNIANNLAGRPYRKGKVNDFRSIHLCLAQAVREGRAITLTFVENVPSKVDRNRRERELIAARRQEAAKGGLPVLNAN